MRTLSTRTDLRSLVSPSGARLRTTFCSLTPATLSLRYLSTHLRHRMQTSRLPIEICEHVIDACYNSLQGIGLDMATQNVLSKLVPDSPRLLRLGLESHPA